MAPFRGWVRRLLRDSSIWLIRAMFAERMKLSTPQHISGSLLLIRPDGIGDFVLFTPMLKHLRRIYASHRISLLLREEAADLARTSPYVDEVVPWKWRKSRRNPVYRLQFLRRLRKRRFDVAMYPVFSREPMGDELLYCTKAREKIGFIGDLANISADAQKRNNRYYTKLVQIDGAVSLELERNRLFTQAIADRPIDRQDFTPELWLSEEDRSAARKLLLEAGVDASRQLIIALFPVAMSPIRLWPLDRYARLADRLSERYGARILVCGSPKDTPVGSEVGRQMHFPPVVLSGKTTLRELAALLELCHAYIGNETGPLHIAAAVGIPTLVIMGGGHFGRFYPYGDRTRRRMVFHEMDCYHCNWRCIYETTRCIQEISLEQAWQATQRFLEEVVMPKRDAHRKMLRM